MSNGCSEWIEIKYDQFWDVPRRFRTFDGESTFLFICDFDEALDDYPSDYLIYRLIPASNMPGDDREFVGKVPVDAVEFDKTLRREIKSIILKKLDPSVRAKNSQRHRPIDQSTLGFLALWGIYPIARNREYSYIWNYDLP